MLAADAMNKWKQVTSLLWLTILSTHLENTQSTQMRVLVLSPSVSKPKKQMAACATAILYDSCNDVSADVIEDLCGICDVISVLVGTEVHMHHNQVVSYSPGTHPLLIDWACQLP